MRRPFFFLRALSCALLPLLLAGCPQPKPVDCAPGFDRLVEGGECVALPPTCQPEVNGSILARCAGEHRQCFQDTGGALCGNCLPGFVEEGGACRPVRTCSALSCADEGRSCEDAGPHRDAACGACLPGNDEQSERCVLRTCAEQPAEGSILEACSAQRRTCESGGVEAACGACWPGYVEDSGSCRPVRTCEALGCNLGHRACAPATATADASCLACRAGFQQLGGTCVAIAGAACDPSAARDLTAACAAEHRSCEPGAEGGAACGACEAGFVEDPGTGDCIEPVLCASLDCGAQQRSCEPSPSARCTTCLPGFVEDPSTGSCRPVKTCNALTCGEGLECVPAGEHSDAFCRTDCGASAIWGGSRCEPCPPCNAVGEEGRFSSPSASGACVCKTSPGYFYTVAGDVGTFRCDADEDGWIRESARLALESGDPVLRENARCELRTVDRFELVNEAGQARAFPLDKALALYETDRNDDAAILAAFWELKGLPAHGGRRLQPRELNRLTKLCHDPRADYNDNGVPDVDDWAGRALASTMRPEHQPFNAYAYFAELHTGEWVAPTSGGHGTYRIREKSRLAAPGSATDVQTVPLAYPQADGSHWRTCEVDRDPAWERQVPGVGMDFAALYDPALAWEGMSHHSQFKCIVVDNEPSSPLERTPGQIAAEGLRLNRCGTTQDPVSASGVNPAAPPVECSLPTATPTAGQVYWASIPYRDYGPHLTGSTYRGGCVNDCIEALPGCAGYDINPAAISCTHDAADFGRFVQCNAWEVCDGFDNDANGQIDDGNPGGGLPCDSGLLGVCQAGTTVCRAGRIQCDQDLQPRGERCNVLDDDCDGDVDENNPEGGGACTVAGQRGECAKSTYVCSAGALTCPQVYTAAAQETCNGLDDNCDGAVDEGENQIGCTDYYLDDDGDGYAAGQTSKRCLCAPSGKYRVTSPTQYDCCDKDSQAKPGQTAWFTYRNQCGSFDWNCNNVEDKADNRSATSGCGTACSGFCCDDPNVGWANAVAGCGETRTYYTNGCTAWSVCGQKSESRTQSCR